MNKKYMTLEDMFPSEQSIKEKRVDYENLFLKKPRLSHYKIIKSGNVFEVYHSQQPVGYNLTSSNRPSRGKSHQKKIHANSIRRAKNNVARIINSNVWKHKYLDCGFYTPQFVTLTFKEKITDIQEANSYFNKFIKRLNYQLYKFKQPNVQYINIIEFQKNGRVHFHSIFFNVFLLEYEREDRWLANIWSHGFIEVEPLKPSKNIAGYLTKYLTKDTIDERLLTKKKYYCSRGVKRPIVINEEVLADQLVMKLGNYQREYFKEHRTPSGNVINYATYILEDEEVKKIGYFTHPVMFANDEK
jgi:hypothetical protein